MQGMNLPSRYKGGKADVIFLGMRTMFQMREGTHAFSEKAEVRVPLRANSAVPRPGQTDDQEIQDLFLR